jgi:hypothetical protein
MYKSLIKNPLFVHSSVIETLFKISNNIFHLKTLSFWTDGSLYQPNPTTSLLNFGWVLDDSILPNISFNGSSRNFASSTKAECLALLTALIVCPPNSHILFSLILYVSLIFLTKFFFPIYLPVAF